jgi:hypothetical protein
MDARSAHRRRDHGRALAQRVRSRAAQVLRGRVVGTGEDRARVRDLSPATAATSGPWACARRACRPVHRQLEVVHRAVEAERAQPAPELSSWAGSGSARADRRGTHWAAPRATPCSADLERLLSPPRSSAGGRTQKPVLPRSRPSLRSRRRPPTPAAQTSFRRRGRSATGTQRLQRRELDAPVQAHVFG